VRIASLCPREGVDVMAKLEWHNPGGSVKDRAALAMVRDAERRGLLASGRTLLDATSGNTGIAYAWIAAARGFKVALCLPANASHERKRILRALGASIIETSPMDGTDGAQREAKRLVAEHPDEYFYPDQYSNDANWMAHYETTAPEVWEQTSRRVTHFVAGLGTTGTFVGTSRRLRELSSGKVRCFALQPATPLHGLEGLKHLETALVPGIWDPKAADEILFVETEDAQEMCRTLARREGLLVGPSSGAAAWAAREVARKLESGVVVTVFPDSGDKYLGEPFWEGGR
jgi:cysteine synthase B